VGFFRYTGFHKQGWCGKNKEHAGNITHKIIYLQKYDKNVWYAILW